MKKIYLFMLMAVGLLISTQSKAQNTVSLTIDETVTEYATLEQAVAAAEVAGEGIIKLLPAYNRYPYAWLTNCTIEGPQGYDTNDKGLFTFHAFNPSGDNAIVDNAIFDKVKAKQPLTPAEEARAKQIVREINPTLAGVPDEMIDLTVDIKFLGGYADWTSDFEVYFDADVTALDYVLAGNYTNTTTETETAYGWLSSFGDQDFTIDADANVHYPLLGTAMPDNTLHYWELMTSVNHFHCGIISLEAEKNAGKTFWCELYLYYPNNKNIKILLNRTPYTFPIKEEPIVVHNQVGETEDNVEIVEQLKAENEGVNALTTEGTNIYPATTEVDADKKCIIVVLTEVKMETTGETYLEKLQSTTFDVTPKYMDAEGNLQTIPNDKITAPITFRLPVIAEYAGMNIAVYHKANDAAEEDFVGVFPVQELNGSYFIELSASKFSKYILKKANNFYERETYDGMIGTICLPYDIVADSLVLADADFFEIDYRNNPTTTSVTEVEGTEVTALEGGKAYVFIANGTLLHVGWKAESVAKDLVTTGAMVGNLSATPVYPAALYEAGAVEPYVVTNTGEFRPCGDGAYVPMNRAYLNMAAVPTTKTPVSGAPRRIVLSPSGANITTGMDKVEVKGMTATKAIINGQLVIMKDNKMFNAQGIKL